MNYFVYILRSKAQETYYIGYTTEIAQRICHHNSGLNRSTARYAPWEVIYLEMYQTKKDALKRELFLKKQKNKSFYRKLVNGA